MRILYTLNDQKAARQLSEFLASEGIENKLEIHTVSDWGSPTYGDLICQLWIYDEDQVPLANLWIKKFEENPEDPLFKSKSPPTVLPLIYSNSAVTHQKQTHLLPEKNKKSPSQRLGNYTLAFLLICTLLYFISQNSEPLLSDAAYPEYLPSSAVFSSPMKKKLYYDYPKAYELADQLVQRYGLEQLQNPKTLSPEGAQLLKQFFNTPYWQGFYPDLIVSVQQKEFKIAREAPLFDKIDQGQVWRLFTPCLLHNDILHLFFNMLWLIVLGKQIEERLGGAKYLVLILLTGIFSNTCQYLMSGSNFIGFSGILCAMLTFIWTRQKSAPWEGYPLQKSTITFIMLYILAMFSIQLLSFYLDVHHQSTLTTGIANTAHLAGASLGAILGRTSIFSWKT